MDDQQNTEGQTAEEQAASQSQEQSAESQSAQPTESPSLEPQVTTPKTHEAGQEQPINLPKGPVLADDQAEERDEDEGRGEE